MKVFESRLKHSELRVFGYGISVLAEGKTVVMLKGRFDGIDILVNGITRGLYSLTESTNVTIISGIDLKVVKRCEDMVVITGEIEHFTPLFIGNTNDISLEPLVIEGNDNPFKDVSVNENR
jgi:hypothetical protein